ncbi:peptide chain release factor N(5)-glutamine methyltransferase [Echinicola vietnamensis]|uniref:Release factor glutamine methyltransferase n=1 Tax=Echinicola vietnamensis (strain DSM 17526 / LMG 23754 / KMM 6221) TaxID=926556 RepID=L0FUY5_ECHVK|nr:peptide chain release factor N(5)-glutamine methyltransferase [Echinicola vietnamensis]AGA77709.1 protein-(glutamine-N5) methyltransferase, release factor-specific [Echinicola vietnamensis DSM 17526]
MISARALYQSYHSSLQPMYPEQEASQLAFWLLEHFLGWKRGDIVRNASLPELPNDIQVAFERLMEGHPIQYILGEAPFYGRDFKVDPSVLIPRNETEELVHLILKDNLQAGLQIMDIGTGSGCIPITLFLEMAHPVVHAMDISKEALQMAQENAKRLGAKVTFLQTDILSKEIPINQLDILVSNPPYVRELEKAHMHKNVLEHEPSLALFVSNEDPLVFYRTIATKGLKALNPGGKLYFEINEAFAKEMETLAESLGYRHVTIHDDLQGKPRMLSAIRP